MAVAGETRECGKFDPHKIERALKHADDYKGDPGGMTRDMVQFFRRQFGITKPVPATKQP